MHLSGSTFLCPGLVFTFSGTNVPTGVAVSHLVPDSANPHCVSDPLPQSFVGSSENWTALNLHSERLSRVPYGEQEPPAHLGLDHKGPGCWFLISGPAFSGPASTVLEEWEPENPGTPTQSCRPRQDPRLQAKKPVPQMLTGRPRAEAETGISSPRNPELQIQAVKPAPENLDATPEPRKPGQETRPHKIGHRIETHGRLGTAK